jgi:hypothetical protein
MQNERQVTSEQTEACDDLYEDDDAAEIRYSLTALGEAVLGRDPRGRGRPMFRGFGPCAKVA